MDFHIGAPILDRDGDQVGKLAHIIVDPNTKEVVEVVMGESGMLRRDAIVPIGAVEDAGSDAILAGLTKEQITDLNTFTDSSYVAPPPELYAQYPWAGAALVGQGLAPVGAASGIESIALTPIVEIEEHIPEGDVDIAPGTEVWATDGKLGKVRDVIMDDQTRRVSSLIIQEGAIFHKDVQIPASAIAGIGSDRVTLNIAKADVETE